MANFNAIRLQKNIIHYSVLVMRSVRKQEKNRNGSILHDQHYKIHRKYIKEHKIFGVCLLASLIVHYKYNNDWLISSTEISCRQRQPHINS